MGGGPPRLVDHCPSQVSGGPGLKYYKCILELN